ncbi:B12-binding domain-containing radical SAM protein [Caloranaerobacter azorensis]|uniref:B12-binding domain-containing radical SAM protein n=1 Tax=Caloranaerobacter azorensis TaxID=116090 RepID=A0A6P1YJM2_9FIRM|nr:radical SAM protein [Caloranaerobacter azorensis]QIB28006.1 B12-binding domain-containing radical SAM protein [Caloranaerobacter azorensis]
MYRIIFVNLHEYIKEDIFDVPLGVLSLATKLKQNPCYNVEIVDFQYDCMIGLFKYVDDFNKNINNMCVYLLDKKPDIIGIYTMCNTYHIALLLGRKIKEVNPKVKIMLGGPQATLTANETLKKFPWIDVIGLGEGENSIEIIVRNLLDDKSFSYEAGVAYVKEGQVINNGIAPLIEDLDSLPMLDYSFFDMTRFKSINIDVGRGCPYSCIFCSTKNFWQRKFRIKSPQRLFEEIKWILYQYGIKNFSFMHDLFTLNKKKVIEFCNLIIKGKLDIKWTCSARIDTLDEEIIYKMASSGCSNIYLGIETGSPRMQRAIGKNLNISKIYEIVDMLNKYNIIPKLSFIYGFPDESEEDVRATIYMIETLAKKYGYLKKNIQLHRLAFFPGTELTERYLDKLTYSEENNSTMMLTNKFPDEVMEIIKNKELFPQFYEYKTELRDRLVMFEKFIPIVYLRTMSCYKDTYRILMMYYDNNILRFYDDYKKEEEDTLRKLSFFNVNKGSNTLFKPFESINNFVQKHNFDKWDKLIKEMSRFEYNIADFLYNTKQEQKTLEFDLDVYNIKKTNNMNNINVPIKVRFIREDEKKISVLKIS